jgi:hypothetical protein
VAARLKIPAGSNRLRFTPGGRFGLLVSPAGRTVAAVDVAVNRIVKQARFEQEPESVACSRQFAYIHHRGGPSLTVIPLAELESPGAMLPIGEVPIGRSPFGRTEAETPAAQIAQVPGGDAVLISHSFDQSIYFLKEGMSAPMGESRNYGGQPRAVLVVDRSLSERTRPGLYESFGRLPEAGSYDLLCFIESPRIVHGFPIEIAPDPKLVDLRDAGKFDMEWLAVESTATVGRPCPIAVGLTDRKSHAPRTDRDVVSVTVFLAPGTWHRRFSARYRGEGIYAFEFTPPREGVYYVNLQDPAPPDDIGQERTLILRAVQGIGPAMPSRPEEAHEPALKSRPNPSG